MSVANLRMHTRMHLLCLLVAVFIICSSETTVSQSMIRGKVVEAKSGSGIPYANMGFGQTGTASLDDGTFLLKVDHAQRNERLKVSCIGYQSRTLLIDSLIEAGGEVIIKLASVVVALDEVSATAKRVSARDIVADAIAAIPQNYTQQPFNLEIYSRVSEMGQIGTSFLMESIIKSYRKGYYEGALTSSTMIHQRTTGTPTSLVFDKKEKKNFFRYEMIPMFDVFLVDVIGVGSKLNYTIFNPDYFKKVDFSLSGITRFESDDVFVINFTQRNRDQTDSISGRLYISTVDLGILKHQRKVGKNYYEVIYKRSNGNYFPYLIKSVYPAQKDNGKYTLQVVHESIVTKVITNEVEQVSVAIEGWHLNRVPHDSVFWNTNYPVNK